LFRIRDWPAFIQNGQFGEISRAVDAAILESTLPNLEKFLRGRGRGDGGKLGAIRFVEQWREMDMWLEPELELAGRGRSAVRFSRKKEAVCRKSLF
jgi:hypothetical protein